MTPTKTDENSSSLGYSTGYKLELQNLSLQLKLNELKKELGISSPAMMANISKDNKLQVPFHKTKNSLVLSSETLTQLQGKKSTSVKKNIRNKVSFHEYALQPQTSKFYRSSKIGNQRITDILFQDKVKYNVLEDSNLKKELNQLSLREEMQRTASYYSNEGDGSAATTVKISKKNQRSKRQSINLAVLQSHIPIESQQSFMTRGANSSTFLKPQVVSPRISARSLKALALNQQSTLRAHGYSPKSTFMMSPKHQIDDKSMSGNSESLSD